MALIRNTSNGRTEGFEKISKQQKQSSVSSKSLPKKNETRLAAPLTVYLSTFHHPPKNPSHPSVDKAAAAVEMSSAH